MKDKQSTSMPIAFAIGFFVIIAVFAVILVLGVKNNKNSGNVNQILGVEYQSPTPPSGLFLGSEQKETIPGDVKGLITPTPAPTGFDFDPDLTPTPTPAPLLRDEEDVEFNIPLDI